MINKERIRLMLVLAMLGLLTVFCADFSAGGPAANPISALLTEFSGKVQVMKASKGVFEAASPDFYLEVNDQVLTGEDGRARIDISDGTIIRLSPLSNFVLTSIEDTDQGTLTRLQLNIGRLWIILKGGVVEVDTPSGLASVRGSYLHVWVDPLTDETNVTCLEGECTLGNAEGTVALVAGQTAVIRGMGDAPEAGKMTHEDVNAWLEANPEATLVVVPLTQTVEANQDQPTPEPKTNTPTPTNTVGPAPTDGPTETPTNTVQAAGCGPADDWVLHTIREGETLKSLAALYRVSEEELRNANCRGTMDFVVAGEKFYVPNVATSTPTKTQTPTPLVTKTPKPTSATNTGTDSPTVMSDPVGPDNEIIANASDCGNAYKITATDADGLSDVKMIYTFDGTLPMRDTAITQGKYKLLPLIADDVYGVSGYIIDASKQTAPVNIRFRFAANDKNGVVTYFPKDDAFDLTDKVKCAPVDTPTTFSNPVGPAGADITALNTCQKTYKIDVVDPDGISWVKMVYTTDGSLPTYGAAGTSYHLMSKVSGATWSVSDVVNTTYPPTTTVKYRFAVGDSNSNVVHFPKTNASSFTDSFGCDSATTWVTPVVPGDITSALQCTNTYSVDVSDANGISEVKMYYTITAHAAAVGPDTGYILLPKTGGTVFSGTYSINHEFDIKADGFDADSTITIEFKALDNRGNWSTYPTTFTIIDSVPCKP